MALPQDSRKLFAISPSAHATSGDWTAHAPDPDTVVRQMPTSLTGKVTDAVANEITDHVRVFFFSFRQLCNCEGGARERSSAPTYTANGRTAPRL